MAPEKVDEMVDDPREDPEVEQMQDYLARGRLGRGTPNRMVGRLVWSLGPVV